MFSCELQSILTPSVPGFEIFYFKQVDSPVDVTGTIQVLQVQGALKCFAGLESLLLACLTKTTSTISEKTAFSKVQHQHFICPNLHQIFKSFAGTEIAGI